MSPQPGRVAASKLQEGRLLGGLLRLALLLLLLLILLPSTAQAHWRDAPWFSRIARQRGVVAGRRHAVAQHELPPLSAPEGQLAGRYGAQEPSQETSGSGTGHSSTPTVASTLGSESTAQESMHCSCGGGSSERVPGEWNSGSDRGPWQWSSIPQDQNQISCLEETSCRGTGALEFPRAAPFPTLGGSPSLPRRAVQEDLVRDDSTEWKLFLEAEEKESPSTEEEDEGPSRGEPQGEVSMSSDPLEEIEASEGPEEGVEAAWDLAWNEASSNEEVTEQQRGSAKPAQVPVAKKRRRPPPPRGAWKRRRPPPPAAPPPPYKGPPPTVGQLRLVRFFKFLRRSFRDDRYSNFQALMINTKYHLTLSNILIAYPVTIFCPTNRLLTNTTADKWTRQRVSLHVLLGYWTYNDLKKVPYEYRILSGDSFPEANVYVWRLKTKYPQFGGTPTLSSGATIVWPNMYNDTFVIAHGINQYMKPYRYFN